MRTEHLVLYHNIDKVLTLEGVAKKEGRHTNESDLGLIEDANIVVDTETNQIEWVGPSKKMPLEYGEIVNAYAGTGELWMPELIECHTHLIHAGDRTHDYALRAQGKTYQQIAQEGGGILTTLKSTRETPLASMVLSAQAELERFQRFGVGTLEIKSGYGLTLESECRMLEAVRALQDHSGMNLVATFLPAHMTPPEFKGRTDDYVEAICREWIPEVTRLKLATFFDAFIEDGFFNLAQTKKMLEAALAAGFKLKLHADQFTDLGGVGLGVELEATSIDHLEQISEKNIQTLANSKTVGVLCPGASLFTGTSYAPARKLLDAGARIAISTDFNPGTCPSRNLPLMTTIACSQMKMTVPEAIAAITFNAAAALGLEHHLGSLEKGKQFRVCHLSHTSYEALPYCFGEFNESAP
ncbi:MAG: imidazolonepropionase [Pseudomonadota bacterium]